MPFSSEFGTSGANDLNDDELPSDARRARQLFDNFQGDPVPMTNDIEPLEPALWFHRIEIIGRGELPSVENSLRHAAHLLQLTPKSFRHLVRLSLDEDAFEALLEAGEFDTAARHLVAQPTALVVDRDRNGPVRATISCAILGRAVWGTGDTLATAVLAAWAGCLLALRDEFGTDLIGLPDQPLQAEQFAPHRRSS